MIPQLVAMLVVSAVVAVEVLQDLAQPFRELPQLVLAVAAVVQQVAQTTTQHKQAATEQAAS